MNKPTHITLVVAFITCLLAQGATGQITSVGPFSGEISETWETFPEYRTSPEYTYLDNPTLIMEGNASISRSTEDDMIVYRPSSASTFRLGTSGEAQVSDGEQGLGINAASGLTTITFNTPAVVIGAYWGAATVDEPATVILNFYDSTAALIGTKEFVYDRSGEGDGLLIWHGWESTSPIRRITYDGYYVVMDGLQADPVPEPSAISLLAIGALAMLKRKRN